MKRVLSWRLILIPIVILLGLAGIWGYGFVRRVDGRSASEWLAFAAKAARTQNYHAVGHTKTGGELANFTLDQLGDGRYFLRTTDGKGRTCDLGFDGKQVWCCNGGQYSTVASTEQHIPQTVSGFSRIMHAGEIAERQVVWVEAYSGHVVKQIAIERQSGIMLAMNTLVKRQLISSMQIDEISEKVAEIKGCSFESAASTRSVSDNEIIKELGGIARPGWLPSGMTAKGTYLGPCSCCGNPMASLQYSDGVSNLTLFEMSANQSCMMGSGYQITENSKDIVATRSIGEITVTAVGNLSSRTLEKVLKSLKSN